MAWGQGEKTLVKSFNLSGVEQVLFELEGDVEVQTWTNNYLRVEMKVTARNGSESVLKSLVRCGRYNLLGKKDGGVFKIDAPGLRKKVKVGDAFLEEGISLKIMAPKGVSIDLPLEASINPEAEDPSLAASL